MLDAKTYLRRREILRKQVSSGILLFLGNEESPMNYPANTFPFRQDSSFLYFFGLDLPNFAALVDVDENREIIFGHDFSIEDIIWMGYQPTLKELAEKAGVKESAPLERLEEILHEALQKSRDIHYLPPYRPETVLKLQQLLGLSPREIKEKASEEFIRAVVAQRSVKREDEIREIEWALDVTHEMYLMAMETTQPGLYEREIAGKMEGIAFANGVRTAFPIILTVNGQILHNHFHGNLLEKGRLLVIDAGAEAPSHYAADITRTIPVTGKFTQKQKEIYDIVLNAQTTAIEIMRPGVKYRDVHLKAAEVMAEGLISIGLLKGGAKAAVEAGAHALFFPHGLGHMLGLDVHDMENLGEKYVGYDEKTERSKQFGLGYLRLAKELQPGYVVTVEPGIYFIPPLIGKWKEEQKFPEFINYQKTEEYLDFGGIRIEDDVLITESGSRVLGKPIPKKIQEIENIVGKASAC